MNEPNRQSASVAVLGGGITGLAAAWHLHRHAPSLNIDVLEAGTRWGGVIRSEWVDGFLVEHSADMFSTLEPWGLELCRQLKIDEELVSTDERFRRAFVVRRGRLLRVPEGFALLEPRRLWPVLISGILSPWGKLRLLLEPFVPPRRSDEDESLADFTIRRFGREVFERLVQPLVGGIYTADPRLLSMQATLPRFVEWERRYGSLIRAARLARTRRNSDDKDPGSSGARYGLFVAPRRGMQTLVDALVGQLPPECLHLGRSVQEVMRYGNRWRVRWTAASGQPEQTDYDAVIMALPAASAAACLERMDGELAAWLRSIPVASVAIACLAVARRDLTHPLDGFGYVVPLTEGRPSLAGSFSSVKFPGRAPEGYVLLRIFFGGACQPELLERSDTELLQLARQELRELLGFHGNVHWERIVRWPMTMPQYHVSHLRRVAAIEERSASWPGLALAGNSYHGVGVPFCVHSGQRAAERVLQYLDARKD